MNFPHLQNLLDHLHDLEVAPLLPLIAVLSQFKSFLTVSQDLKVNLFGLQQDT